MWWGLRRSRAISPSASGRRKRFAGSTATWKAGNRRARRAIRGGSQAERRQPGGCLVEDFTDCGRVGECGGGFDDRARYHRAQAGGGRDSPAQRRPGRLAIGERVEQFEAVRRRKDGSLVDVSLKISPIVDAS